MRPTLLPTTPSISLSLYKPDRDTRCTLISFASSLFSPLYAKNRGNKVEKGRERERIGIDTNGEVLKGTGGAIDTRVEGGIRQLQTSQEKHQENQIRSSPPSLLHRPHWRWSKLAFQWCCLRFLSPWPGSVPCLPSPPPPPCLSTGALSLISWSSWFLAFADQLSNFSF